MRLTIKDLNSNSVHIFILNMSALDVTETRERRNNKEVAYGNQILFR